MNVKTLRAILAQAEELYQKAGNERATRVLQRFREAIATRDLKTVDAFAKLAARIKP